MKSNASRRYPQSVVRLILTLAVLVIALVGLLVTGCDSDTGVVTTSAPEAPTQGGTLTVAIAEPAFIDPLNLVESEGIQVGNALFDSLVAFDPKTSQLVPAVAEEWGKSEDATVWTFHLRQGTTFHNGREVVAADFKYAWERLCDPANESWVAYHLAAVDGFDEMQAGAASELRGVKAVDDHTLEVTLSYPFADFEYVVGHTALAPVPREEVEKDPAAYAEMPIGNGPFMMAGPWQHDQSVSVVRYDGYYADPAYVDGVVFKIFTDPDTAFLEFKAGTVDFTMFPSGQAAAVVEEYGESPDGLEIYPGQQTLLGPDVTVYFFVFNTEDPAFADAKVRQAISLAINREAIATAVFGDLRAPASSIIPPGIVGYEADAWTYCRFDRDEAAKLLAEAGHPDGQGLPEITLLTNSGGEHEDVLALIQADLKAVGIAATIDSIETGEFLQKLDAKDFQIARYSWTADYPIIDNFVYPLFGSDSADNVSQYAETSVDEAIIAARGISDSAARIKAYQELVGAIGDDAPALPIVMYRHQNVGSDRVHGLVYSPLGLCDFESCWLEL